MFKGIDFTHSATLRATLLIPWSPDHTPHTFQRSPLSQLSFIFVLPSFSLNHSLPQFPLVSLPLAPTPGTLGALVGESQAPVAPPRERNTHVCHTVVLAWERLLAPGVGVTFADVAFSPGFSCLLLPLVRLFCR